MPLNTIGGMELESAENDWNLMTGELEVTRSEKSKDNLAFQSERFTHVFIYFGRGQVN